MSQNKITPKLFIALLCFALFFFQMKSAAAQSIIRDTELENTFRTWMAPLLKAANLGPGSVNLILVNSPQVNAFVAGGANIFLYTGLIDKSETPEEIIGVLAHEIGHIVGGHLIGGRAALERASYESILGTVIGIGAAILSGNGQAAGAISSGANSLAQRRFLAHSRVNESSADQAALRILESAGISSTGLKSFLEKLGAEELLPPSDQSEYMRTHPITSNRIDALESRIKNSAFTNQKTSKAMAKEHALMKGKLLGYIDPGRVVWRYNDTDQSVPALYARAVGAYRQNKFNEALKTIDQLLEKEPDNAYFHELKGEILLSAGKISESLKYFTRAIEAAPKTSLIRIELGKALLQLKQSDESIERAIEILKHALVDEPRSTRAHRLLATAYGQRGEENLAKLHLAEEAVLQRRLPYAKKLIEGAIKDFKENSMPWLKSKDLLAHIENLQGKKK